MKLLILCVLLGCSTGVFAQVVVTVVGSQPVADPTSAGYLFEQAEKYRLSDPPDVPHATELYLKILSMTGHPEVRRAQMELGNLVIDGKYSAGDDAKGHALNLEWARIITQELLGSEDYKIAIDYELGRAGIAKDQEMWRRFCRRAASYNLDIAQQFYGEFLLEQRAPASVTEGYAWLRLASDKRDVVRTTVLQLEKKMSSSQLLTAQSYFDGLVEVRKEDGAYYASSDPLKHPSTTELQSMRSDDPDVQIRQAFELEKGGRQDDYESAMGIYRRVRDRRKIDIRLLLSSEAASGTNGVPKEPTAAEYYLKQAAYEGSTVAKLLLAGDLKGAEQERLAGDVIIPPTPPKPTHPQEPGLYHVGGGVTPPRVLRTSNPTLTAEATKMKFSGGVEVYCIVDESGTPIHVRVDKPVGMGLDEKAIQAVEQYKFKPAMKDGKPVKVDMYIDVNFSPF